MIYDVLIVSNRWRHLLGGIIIGVGADDWYCATYAGVGIAGALELKDKLYGNKFDWLDFGFTLCGVAFGYGIRWVISKC